MRKILSCVAVLTLGGCSTVLPVSAGYHVDPETGPSCTNVCRQVGMKVGAIVFIGSMGGCVCEPEAAAPRAGEKSELAPRASNGSGAASGAVVVMLAAQGQQEGGQRGSPSIPSIPSIR